MGTTPSRPSSRSSRNRARRGEGRPAMKAPRSLKARALQLLAQRDQSPVELRRKLSGACARDGTAGRPVTARRPRSWQIGCSGGGCGPARGAAVSGVCGAPEPPDRSKGRSRRGPSVARGEALPLGRALCRVTRECAVIALRQSSNPARAGSARRRAERGSEPGAGRFRAGSRSSPCMRAEFSGPRLTCQGERSSGAISRRPRFLGRRDPARPSRRGSRATITAT